MADTGTGTGESPSYFGVSSGPGLQLDAPLTEQDDLFQQILSGMLPVQPPQTSHDVFELSGALFTDQHSSARDPTPASLSSVRAAISLRSYPLLCPDNLQATLKLQSNSLLAL